MSEGSRFRGPAGRPWPACSLVSRLVVALAASAVLGLSPLLFAEAPDRAVDEPATVEDADAVDPAAEETGKSRFEGEVVVTATRTERAVDKLPMSVTVIGREEVAQVPALQLDDVLRTVPGVNLPLGTSTTQHPTTHLLSMRGLGGSRALMMVDGVPLNDPFFGYIPWSMVPLENIERVEVVRGGGSSLFGTYALGGTVNVLRRRATGARVSMTALYGSQATGRFNLSAAQPVSEWAILTADIAYTDTDGYILAPPDQRGDIDVPSPVESLNIDLGVQLAGDSGWEGSVHATVFSGDSQTGTPLAVQSREAVRLSARVHKETAGGGELTAGLFLHDGEFDTQNTNLLPDMGRDEEYVSNIHTTLAKEVGATAQWSRPLGRTAPLFLLGVDLRRISGEDRAQLFDEGGELTGREAGAGVQYLGGLFSQVSLFPTERLEILASARLDTWSNRDGRTSTDPGEVTRHPDRSFTRLDPRISTHLDLGKGLGLRASVYRAFRAPNLNELYRSFASKTLEVRPNPELEPETLLGGEIGFDAALPRLDAQLNVFYNEVEDLIARTLVSVGAVKVFDMVNVGAIRSRGVEAFADVAIGPHWSANFGYAYTDAVITDNPLQPSRVGNRVPDVPEHSVTIGVRYHHPSGATIVLRARHLSDQYGDDANRLLLEAHTVVDASVVYPIGRRVELLFIGENLANEEYIANARAWEKLGQPRRVLGGLRVCFPGREDR